MDKYHSSLITNPDITNYLFNLAKVDDDHVLLEMEAHASKHRFPIIGRLVGRLLSILAASLAAKRIFELGSGFGYSAYWFAKAVGPDGKVFCTDGDGSNFDNAKNYLSRSKVWDRVDFKVGMAQDIFKDTPGEFDIIYNDVDKEQYPGVFELAWERIRKGGLYIADNALWFGRVIPGREGDEPITTEAIRTHNQMIFNHHEFETTLIPLRDGVIVARRKS